MRAMLSKAVSQIRKKSKKHSKECVFHHRAFGARQGKLSPAEQGGTAVQ
jgi:hypothetical protein